MSHAGSALLAQAADKLGLTEALSLRLAGLKARRRGHDPGRVIRDLAVMLADGGECVSDLGAVRDQGVWLEIVMLAHDLIVWTQALLLPGELAKAEPQRVRYRLLHVTARLAFHSREAKLHLQRTWPWATELAAAFRKLKALPENGPTNAPAHPRDGPSTPQPDNSHGRQQ